MAAISRRMLGLTLRGLVRIALFVTALTVAAFGIPGLVASGFVAAGVGVVLYASALAVYGLAGSWRPGSTSACSITERLRSTRP